MTRSLRPAVIAALSLLPLLCAASLRADSAAADKAFQGALAKTKTGDYAGALALLEPFRKDPSAGARTMSMLGVLYLETGKPADALAVLKPLADPATAEPAVLYNAGRAALATRDVKLAESYFVRSMKAAPQGSPAMRELGMLYAAQGKVVEAYKLLYAYAAAYPEETEARTMAALMALRIGRPAEAERLIEGLNPDNPAVRLLRGGVAVAAGDGKGALEILAPIATTHSPAMDIDYRKTMAEAHLLNGDPKAAIAVLTAKPTNTPTLQLLLATAERQSGDAAKALATLKPLADLLPDGPQGLPDPRIGSSVALEYGRSLVASNAAAQALPWFEKATRINPLSRPAWLALADAYERAQRKDDAAAARAKADALKPKPAPAAPAKQ